MTLFPYTTLFRSVLTILTNRVYIFFSFDLSEYIYLIYAECFFALKAWNAQNAGAAAVLIVDNIDEPLLTMDTPEEFFSDSTIDYVQKIAIPSALIEKSFGESLKKTLQKIDTDTSEGNELIVKMDWRESMPHPDERVEYEFWTNSNDECGKRCEEQLEFVKNFRGHAQLLERDGYSQFTPHYITWFCPEPFRYVP